MPIISKATWDKFTQEEKEKISDHYKWLYNLPGNDENAGAIREMEDLFGKENLQPKPLTYRDVERELFKDKKAWYINDNSAIQETLHLGDSYRYKTNLMTSRKQAEKLLAINKLLNVCAWADMRDEIAIEISAELTEKINGIISDEELKLILTTEY